MFCSEINYDVLRNESRAYVQRPSLKTLLDLMTSVKMWKVFFFYYTFGNYFKNIALSFIIATTTIILDRAKCLCIFRNLDMLQIQNNCGLSMVSIILVDIYW